jgi:hypothetical protein
MPEWQKRLFISNARRSGGDARATIGKKTRVCRIAEGHNLTMLVDMEAIKSTVKRGVDIIEACLNMFHGTRMSCHEGLR